METSIGLVQVKLCETLVEFINDKAEYEGTTFDVALERIVFEWVGGKEIEPVKSTPNISGLSDLGESLKNIEERLDYIESLLVDAQVTIVKTD